MYNMSIADEEGASAAGGQKARTHINKNVTNELVLTINLDNVCCYFAIQAASA